VFFSIVDRQALRRGDFLSVDDLTATIGRFCRSWNEYCQPFSWTKPAGVIRLYATKRGERPRSLAVR
jgi:hypothetical protein